MRLKMIVAAVVVALSQGVAAQTTADTSVSDAWKFPEAIAYPGYTWGGVMYPASVIKGDPERHDVLFNGRTEQGADWFKFGANKEFTFNTFVAANYAVDSQGLSYNNKVQPQIGAKIRHAWANGGSGELGVAYTYEDRWKTDAGQPSTGNGVQVFYNFYMNWDLKRSN